MSRRHLTLAFVLFSSLVISACSSSPTAPVSRVKVAGASADSLAGALTDSASRGGWIGSF